MLIRGLVDRQAAEGLAARVEATFADREQAGGSRGGGYEPFRPDGDYTAPLRPWIAETGGLLLVDAPVLASELLDLYAQAGIQQLATAYLGEPVVLSVEKTTLRQVEPSANGAWHQDGSFMGSVPSLNLWLALSPCGVDAPGLDIVPSRLHGLVDTGTDGAFLSTQVSDDAARRAAGSAPIARPVFEPGDAVLFDELCLHQTAAHPNMTRSRLAVESWFFGGTAMPKEYTPVAPVVA